jgi:hypothetical protein
MNTKFDELAKGLAQATTRRQALKKFGVCLAGMALACFGLANRAKAGGQSKYLCCSYVGTQGGAYLLCVPAAQGCPGSPTFATPVDKCTGCGESKPPKRPIPVPV